MRWLPAFARGDGGADAVWRRPRGVHESRLGRRTAPIGGFVAVCCIVLATTALALRSHVPSASDGPNEPQNPVKSRLGHHPYIKVFGGPHTPRYFTRIAFAPWNWTLSDERIAVVATGTMLGEAFSGALTVEWETLYAYHWGTQRLYELGGALYFRWNRFPWNHLVRTTYAVGVGPSWTSEAAHYEPKGGRNSRWLMQLNTELNLYHPENPRWALLLRLQHRSGMFGLINRIRGGSNFLTFGVRRQF